MNILFHCWEYPPRGSGIGRYVYHMSRALRESGHFIVIVTSYGNEGPTEEAIENGIIYRIYPIEDIGKKKTTELVLRKAQEHRIDWIEGTEHLGETALLLAHSMRPPVLIKTHYNDVLKRARYAQAYYPWQKILIDLACWRDRERLRRELISIEKADILTSPTKRILQETEQQGLRLPVRRFVVPNPITPPTAWVNREDLDPTVTLIGRIDIGKGIEYLPEILDTLTPRFPNLRFEIVGGDSYARLLGSTRRWLLRKLGRRSKYVRFLGPVGHKELDEIYRRTWVVIVPSRWDTFPTVVLEAMIRGKAIVASPHGGMPEMLSGTECVVADPATSHFPEAVADFLFDLAKRRRAGETALDKARYDYDPKKIASDYIAILNRAA